MARYNADCCSYDTSGNAGKCSVLACFRGYLSELCFLLYAIIGHLFFEYRPEVAVCIHQKRLLGYNINRVLPFVIENDSDRKQACTNYIKSENLLCFFLVSVCLSSDSRLCDLLCIRISGRHFERHYLRFIACTSRNKGKSNDH
jgi:hypothetical protein